MIRKMESIIVNETKYEVKNKLFDALCGSVFVVTKDDEEFVVKKVERKKIFKGLTENPINELYMYQDMNHPNVISLIDHFPTNECLIFVFPKFDCDLFDFCEKLRVSEREKVKYAKSIFIQIGDAIKYLHSRNIYHGDISLENIFLKETSDPEKIHAVLADFGMAGFCEKDEKVNKSLGKQCYINRENFYGNHNPFKSDVWQFCMCIYMFFTRYGLYESACMSNIEYNQLMEKGFSKMCKLKCKLTNSLIELFDKVFMRENEIPDIETILKTPFFEK